tara:strand:- start:248 stop:955 length:708 start_codon:yes stop_codon:yes gene_type:complete
MILLTSYYKCENEDRHEEYLTCLRKNITNNFVSKIVVFLRDTLCVPEVEHEKINYVQDPEHTYRSYFEYCNEHHQGEKCIIANSDMILNDTIGLLKDGSMEGKFFCLTRWDIKEDGSLKFYRPPHGPDKSQDVWIFQSPININMEEANIPLAHQGCDNRIAMVARKSGLDVYNPSLRIKCEHLHLVDYRSTAGDRDIRILGNYLFVEPSYDIREPAKCESVKAWYDEDKKLKFTR